MQDGKSEKQQAEDPQVEELIESLDGEARPWTETFPPSGVKGEDK